MDKKHGHGVFRWESGNVYKGHYKEDQRHGYGEMYWTDGSVYKGEWVRGIQHGFGEMIFPDGTKKIGIFDHNTFVAAADLPDSHYQLGTKFSSPNERSTMRDNFSFDAKANSKFTMFNNSRRTSIDKEENEIDSMIPSRIFHPNSTKNSAMGSRGRSKITPKKLPPIIDRITKTNYGTRKKDRKANSDEKFNKTSSDFSYIDENIKRHAINMLNKRVKMSRKNKNKPVWKPSGKVPHNDGYSVIQKMFY
jgi:hypothetical protein